MPPKDDGSTPSYRPARMTSQVQYSVNWLHPLQVMRPCLGSMSTLPPHMPQTLMGTMSSACLFSMPQVSHRGSG